MLYFTRRSGKVCVVRRDPALELPARLLHQSQSISHIRKKWYNTQGKGGKRKKKEAEKIPRERERESETKKRSSKSKSEIYAYRIYIRANVNVSSVETDSDFRVLVCTNKQS